MLTNFPFMICINSKHLNKCSTGLISIEIPTGLEREKLSCDNYVNL